MMPVRSIALLFEYATLNGGERSILAAVNWLQKNDDRFEFSAIASPVGRLANLLQDLQIPIRPWSSWDASGQRRSADDLRSSLKQILALHPSSLLHGNSLAMGRLIGRIAHELQIPTTAHLRDIIKLSRSAVEDLNGNQALIAVSTATREFHIHQGLNPDQVFVVHNGVDLQAFSPKKRTGYFCHELGLQDNLCIDRQAADSTSIRLIATIGQIGLRKGQDILATAALNIVSRLPNVHFLIVGERNSRKEESIRFEQQIREDFSRAGLADRLHLVGYRDDIAAFLNEIDLLVHPANQEPYGRVLLEASAAGVPIVATNVGGTAEIVVDGKTGVLVPPRNPPALADAIVDLLTDTAKAARFGRAARERAELRFGISRAAIELANVWDRYLN